MGPIPTLKGQINQQYRRGCGVSGRLNIHSKLACFLFCGESLAGSQRARVQRGESATARCASTRDFRLFPFSAALAERVSPHSYRLSRKERPGCPLLRASDEHSFIVRVLRARRAPGRSSFSYCWIAESSHLPSWIRMKVQASPDSVGISSLPSTR
jgi:hypothetical protein